MVIEEKYSRYWIQITVALGLGTILILGADSWIEDLYWQGMSRVVAFGFLAATVFSALKVMQGKHTIEIQTEQDNLVITYRKNDREISRDVFALSNISTLQYEQHGSFLGSAIFLNSMNLRFVPADSDRPLNLIEVNGRALPLTRDDARQIAEFVRSRAPGATISGNP